MNLFGKKNTGKKQLLPFNRVSEDAMQIRQPRAAVILQTRLFPDALNNEFTGLIAKYRDADTGTYDLYERRYHIIDGMQDNVLNGPDDQQGWTLDDLAKRMHEYETALVEIGQGPVDEPDKIPETLTVVHYNPENYFYNRLVLDEHLALCEDTQKLLPVQNGTIMGAGRFSDYTLSLVTKIPNYKPKLDIDIISRYDLMNDDELNKFLARLQKRRNDTEQSRIINYALRELKKQVAVIQKELADIIEPKKMPIGHFLQIEEKSRSKITAPEFLEWISQKDKKSAPFAKFALLLEKICTSQVMYLIGAETHGSPNTAFSGLHYNNFTDIEKDNAIDRYKFETLIEKLDCEALINACRLDITDHMVLYLGIEMARSAHNIIASAGPDWSIDASAQALRISSIKEYRSSKYDRYSNQDVEIELRRQGNKTRKSEKWKTDQSTIYNRSMSVMQGILGYYMTFCAYEGYPVFSDILEKSAESKTVLLETIDSFCKKYHGGYYPLKQLRKNPNDKQSPDPRFIVDVNITELYKNLCSGIIDHAQSMELSEIEINKIRTAMAKPDLDYSYDLTPVQKKLDGFATVLNRYAELAETSLKARAAADEKLPKWDNL